MFSPEPAKFQEEWKMSTSDSPSFLGRLFNVFLHLLYKIMNSLYIVDGFYSLYNVILTFLFLDNSRIEWKTHWQSPVCRDILRRKFYMTKSKSALFWAAVNLLVAGCLFVVVKSSVIAKWFGNYSNIVWYAELAIISVLLSNALIALCLYLWSVVSKPMPVSPAQKRLFRIDDRDPGFTLKVDNGSLTETPHRNTNMQFTSWREDLDGSTQSCLSVTPLNYSAHSWGSPMSSASSLDTTSNSWTFQRNSPTNYTSTPKSWNGIETYSPKKNSLEFKSFPFERQIRNRKQLEAYLKDYEEEEKKFKSMSFEESKVLISNVASVENNPMSALRKCRYQKACRLPHSEKTEDDSNEIYCGDNMWYKLKITDKMLTLWCEYLRKWICQTILVKLVQEIEGINNTLSQMCMPEFQIGAVSLYVLHQIALTKAQNLPTLSSILPYVDMHLNQKYLIRRLKDLAHGGCMGDFKWNSGGSYDNKQWCDDLPTDSAIIMHVLCCYFDAHLPPETHFPEGKPFTSKYFKKMSEKPVLTKDVHYIYQSSINPPCFKVAIGEELYSLPRGRNNLFCAILIFLHHIKTKECGMLGRVNLGPSGLNILWVIDW